MKHQHHIEPGVHQAGSHLPSENGAGVAASDLPQGQSAFLRGVAVIGAAGAIVIAIMGLLGYMPGLELLGSVREDYIPMAPSTAISFIVLAGILLAIPLLSLSRTTLSSFGALAALVSLFGLLEVAGYLTGMDLNFEDALVPSAGYLGETPIARMSYATGAAFFLAGLAVLTLVLRLRRIHIPGIHFGHCAGSLGSLVLGISLIFCLAYLLGSPLLYGQGTTVPMALTTALAFLMLGGATVGVAGEAAFPANLLATARRPGRSMSARLRILLLTLIMAVACVMVMATMAVILYQHELQEQQEMLQVTAQNQARLIEAVARYAKIHSPERSTEATLSQVIEAHERYRGFGETGEFTLARRDGNTIVFILRHGRGSLEYPVPVAFGSELAEPMRRALKGLSGTFIGLDYRGTRVLAAYEPVAWLDLGIVTKIDLAEFRTPFFRSGLTATLVGLLIILAGTMLFFRISNPILVQLEAHARDLEREVKERARLNTQLEAKNRELEQMLYVASHDLRSPLVNIDGYSMELENAIEDLRRALDKDQTSAEGLSAITAVLAHDMPEALHFIRTSASKMDSLLNGLLKLSRSGRAALTIDSLDMNELISSVVDACEFQIKQAEVEVNVAELPPCLGDAVQVNQVFSNLLGNALQYLDPHRPGVIRISGRVEAERCVYCVADNGIGIAPAHQEKIFEIFHRLDPTKGEGDGLGLNIVKQVLGSLGGNVWVESKPGEGCHFYVALPATRENT